MRFTEMKFRKDQKTRDKVEGTLLNVNDPSASHLTADLNMQILVDTVV